MATIQKGRMKHFIFRQDVPEHEAFHSSSKQKALTYLREAEKKTGVPHFIMSRRKGHMK